MATARIVLILLAAFAASFWQTAKAEAPAPLWEQPRGGRCHYPQAQQMFDLSKHGLSGCYKLKSLHFIFGDAKSRRVAIDASRYLTANLVFIGTVSHVIKEAEPSLSRGGAFKVRVQVHCYLKGKLDREEVEVVGFGPGFGTGLCLDVKCEDGDKGLFFVTYTDGELRINENGFVREGRELDSVMKTLRCRENRDWFSVWPTTAGMTATPHCQVRPADPSAEPNCEMSLATALQYLGVAFIQYEWDLKPECQEGKDFVIRRLIKSPVTSSVSFSRLSSNRASRGRPEPQSVAAVASVAVMSALTCLLRCEIGSS